MSDLRNLINRLRENAQGEGIAIFAEAADALAALEATSLRLQQMDRDCQRLRYELFEARRPLQVEISRLKQQKDDAYARGKLEGWNAGRADGEVAEKILAGKLADAQARISELEKPIDMILHCPACLEQHIDEPEPRSVTLNRVRDSHSPAWTNPPHRSHLCHHCRFVWRPADVATNGVAEIKTKGKNDMVLFDGPREVMRQIRIRDAAQPKLDWEGDRP